MALSAKEKIFNREVEALRALIQSKAKPFADDKKAQRDRVKHARKHLEYFGLTYFPHYLDTPPSELHKYFSLRYPQMVIRGERNRRRRPGSGRRAQGQREVDLDHTHSSPVVRGIQASAVPLDRQRDGCTVSRFHLVHQSGTGN